MYPQAAQCFQKSLDIKDQLHGDQAMHPARADSFVYLGDVCTHQQAPKEALYFYGEAEKIYESGILKPKLIIPTSSMYVSEWEKPMPS